MLETYIFLIDHVRNIIGIFLTQYIQRQTLNHQNAKKACNIYLTVETTYLGNTTAVLKLSDNFKICISRKLVLIVVVEGLGVFFNNTWLKQSSIVSIDKYY